MSHISHRFLSLSSNTPPGGSPLDLCGIRSGLAVWERANRGFADVESF